MLHVGKIDGSRFVSIDFGIAAVVIDAYEADTRGVLIDLEPALLSGRGDLEQRQYSGASRSGTRSSIRRFAAALDCVGGDFDGGGDLSVALVHGKRVCEYPLLDDF